MRVWRHVVLFIVIVGDALHYDSCRNSTRRLVFNGAYEFLARYRLVRVIVLHSLSKLSWYASSLNAQSTHHSRFGLGVLLDIFDVVIVDSARSRVALDLLDRRKLHLYISNKFRS